MGGLGRGWQIIQVRPAAPTSTDDFHCGQRYCCRTIASGLGLMAGKIFVNYRRDDERSTAARVRDRLAGVFGATNVFMDVDNLLAGQRFDKELAKALAETDVFLAVIGPKWMELFAQRQASGERDYVREEIAGALKRGILVIPVLIERAPMPRGANLPEDIREIVLHQKHDISHERFGRDIEELVVAINAGRRAMQAETGPNPIRAPFPGAGSGPQPQASLPSHGSAHTTPECRYPGRRRNPPSSVRRRVRIASGRRPKRDGKLRKPSASALLRCRPKRRRGERPVPARNSATARTCAQR